MMNFDATKIDISIRDKQIEEFETEIQNLQKHQKLAKQIIKDQIPKTAKILVLDVSQGAINPKHVKDEKLFSLVKEFQFGGGPINYGESFRAMLGFDKDDKRFVVCDMTNDSSKADISDLDQFDAFIIGGGPAMPSELLPGLNTNNTSWLKETVQVLNKIREHHIPGYAFCLGHQLWNYALGSHVKKCLDQREFGTVSMIMHEPAKNIRLLDGITQDDGMILIHASHCESVKTAPNIAGMKVVMSNKYNQFQAAAFSLDEAKTIEQADENDQLVISIQNHPEFLGLLMEVLRRTRRLDMQKEGIDSDHLVFRDTHRIRNIFLNFLKLVGRRARR